MTKQSKSNSLRIRNARLLLVLGFICLIIPLFSGISFALSVGLNSIAWFMMLFAALGTVLLAMGIRRLSQLNGEVAPIQLDATAEARTQDSPSDALAESASLEEPNEKQTSSAEQLKQPSAAETQADTSSDSKPDDVPDTFYNFPHHLELRPKSAGALIAREHVKTMQRMLSNSEDVFATAKDLANTRNSIDAFSMLADMLSNADALDHPDPPKIKPIRLSRNGRMWLGSDVSIATDETYDAVISLEAAFNLNVDMLLADGAHPKSSTMTTSEKACCALAHASKQHPDYNCKIDYSLLTYGRSIPDESEWALRERMANAVENAAMPFRLIFDMKTNAKENIVLISLEIPRPTCFSIISDDKITQEALARDYAYRTAVFMAENAIGAMRKPESKRTVITCHTRGETIVRLSLDVEPQDLPALRKATECIAPMPVPSFPNLHMSCENDWLDEVDAHIDYDDPLLNPQCYTDPVETSKQQCSPLLAQAANVQNESDLGILEGAAKQQAWANLESRLGTTTESAVAVTKDLRETTQDLEIRDACDRVMRALVEGAANPEDVDELERVFHGDNHLEDTLRFCVAAYASRQESQLLEASSKLERAITPSMQISVLDDTESVFRYFRNTAERLAYNLYSDDKRQVRLVSKAYYTANEMMAYMLCSLNRPDEAEPYADEIMRIAPFSANAIITKARVLEEQMRVFEAIDLVNGAIPRCATVSDAALCYYRMAYLLWNIGRHVPAAACYRMCIALNTDIVRQAQTELDELIESDDNLHNFSVEKARETLKREQINTWSATERGEEIAKAAVLCTDEGLYRPARSLTLSLLEFFHDDALIDVCRSFSPSE